MNDEYVPIFIVGIIFFSAVYVIKILSDTRIRRRLIESGQIDEKIKYLFFDQGGQMGNYFTSVKWGLVLIAVGAAFLISRLYSYPLEPDITFGLMFFLAGVAFLIYYVLAKKHAEQHEDSDRSPAAAVDAVQPSTRSIGSPLIRED